MMIYCDRSVGETRWLETDHAGRALRLALVRWTQCEAYPALGRAYCGRVRAMAGRLGGAFLDLGSGGDGFLPVKPGTRGVCEGAMLRVEVAAEPRANKGPRLRRLPGPARGEAGPEPGFVAHSDRAPWSPCDPIQALVTGPSAREACDAAVDEALAGTAPLAGGGDVAFDAARAFMAVDIDAGAREGSADPQRFAEQTNIAAAPVIARQIALRSVGGMVVVDALTVKGAPARERVRAAFVDAFHACDLRADVAAMSRNGLMEIGLPHARRPVAEVLLDNGRRTVETCALDALRALERAGEADRGARLELQVGATVGAWLERDIIAWRDAMRDRLGARFELTIDSKLGPDHFAAYGVESPRSAS